MSKFKIGDKVRRIKNLLPHYGPYYKGEEFNIQGINDSGNVIDPRGQGHDPNYLELVKTSVPLYSEEQAVAFLKEKGYTVEAPPPPLTGEVVVYQRSDGSISSARAAVCNTLNFTTSGYKKLAVLKWTEGQGL